MSNTYGLACKNDFENALQFEDIGVMFFDEEFRLRRVTDTVLKYGFVSEEKIGAVVEDLALPKLCKNIPSVIRKSVAKNTEISEDILHRNKAWNFRIRPYYSSNGKIAGVTVLIIDVTLGRASELRTHALMKNMSVAILEGLYNEEAGLELLYSIESIANLLGYSEKEYNRIMKSNERFVIFQNVYLQLEVLAHAAKQGDKEPLSEFRIRRNDGNIIWVEARCEFVQKTETKILVQFILIDVTKIHEEREKLRLEKRKLAYIVEMTADTLFEYSIPNDIMVYSKQEDSRENKSIEENYLAKLMIGGNTRIEDEDVVSDFYDRMKGGAREIKAVFRKKAENGEYHWLKIEGRTIYSVDGRPVKVVGRIVNVDEEKNREEELARDSERDSLTGLFNHKVCIEQIKKQMSRIKANEKGYLAVLDVDDFKHINDENGHLYGDAVLCALSDALKSFFPTSVKGRIGGDEFMVYVRNIELNDLKQRLSGVLKEISKLGDDNPSAKGLSCSIGVAVCTKAHHDYEESFETADQALYLIKKTGKNSYTICECGDYALQGGHRYIAELDEQNEYNQADSLISNDDELIMFSLELMNNVSNYRKGLGVIADRICSYVGFDGMVLITSEENSYAITFDWTGDKAHPYARKLYPKNQQRAWCEIEKMFTAEDDYLILRGEQLKRLGLRQYKSILIGRLQSAKDSTQYMVYIDSTTDRSWERELSVLLRLTHLLVSKVVQMQTDERNREEVEYRMNYDALTGLPSYTKFLELAAEFIESHIEGSNKDYYIGYGDFVNFSYVNELYGYSTGDHILELTARRIQRAGKICVYCSRITADQFVGLMEVDKGVNPGKIIEDSFLQFNDVVKMRYSLCKLTILCGLCKITEPDVGISVLVDRANAARKYGKEKGETGCVLYTKEMWERNEDEKEVYVNINDALKNREFQVYLQPKISMKTGKIVGAESLVRWRRADGTLFPPDRFIPVLEKNGFITKVDYYVLEETLRYLKELGKDGIEPIPISVNFSRVHYDDPKFADTIMDYLRTYDVDPGLLEAEITEYNYLHDIKSLNPAILELQNQGVLVSIDDFGSGYSSLNILSKVTADIIKLDRLFLEDMEEQKEFLVLLTEMINKLGYQIIMEGVETLEQMQFIASTKCDMVQGYYVSKPMPMAEFKKFLKEYNSKAKPWK